MIVCCATTVVGLLEDLSILYFSSSIYVITTGSCTHLELAEGSSRNLKSMI